MTMENEVHTATLRPYAKNTLAVAGNSRAPDLVRLFQADDPHSTNSHAFVFDVAIGSSLVKQWSADPEHRVPVTLLDKLSNTSDMNMDPNGTTVVYDEMTGCIVVTGVGENAKGQFDFSEKVQTFEGQSMIGMGRAPNAERVDMVPVMLDGGALAVIDAQRGGCNYQAATTITILNKGSDIVAGQLEQTGPQACRMYGLTNRTDRTVLGLDARMSPSASHAIPIVANAVAFGYDSDAGVWWVVVPGSGAGKPHTVSMVHTNAACKDAQDIGSVPLLGIPSLVDLKACKCCVSVMHVPGCTWIAVNTELLVAAVAIGPDRRALAHVSFRSGTTQTMPKIHKVCLFRTQDSPSGVRILVQHRNYEVTTAVVCHETLTGVKVADEADAEPQARHTPAPAAQETAAVTPTAPTAPEMAASEVVELSQGPMSLLERLTGLRLS